MKINNQLKLAAAVAAGMVLVGCGSDDEDSCFTANTCSASGYNFPADAVYIAQDAEDGDDIFEAIETAIFNSSTGSVLILPKGNFTVSGSVVIASASELTLAGHGIDATKLDFEGSQGEDGISFDAGNNITIRDLGVHNANKNGIKATGVSGIHFNYTATVWEDELTTETESAYGIYPVASFNVLVENSYAKGSNDAGIYVGQSENVVVRNNIAEYNIAGIEIENSDNADVYNNQAFNNSGGILSFDLPGTDVKGFGTNIRIFNNDTYENNTPNVGHGTVGAVPQGTGILVLSSADVEIYNNNITDNLTTGIAITSYFLLDPDAENYGTSYGASLAIGWTPTVKNVHVYNNTFSDNGTNAPLTGLLKDIILGYLTGQNFSETPQDVPAVVYDGIGELLANTTMLAGMGVNPYADSEKSCIHDNINNNKEGLDLNIGSVYGTDPAAAGNIVEGAPSPTLRVSKMNDESTLLNCATTPDRLDAAVVTINDVVYGCTGDDVNLAACKL